MRSESRLKTLIDCRLDIESEKITKFVSFEHGTTSIASNIIQGRVGLRRGSNF